MLVPEDRQHQHRLAKPHRLGGRVVAPVGDHRVDLGQDRGLGQELLADHVVGQFELSVLRPGADDIAVPGLGQHLDQPLHQRQVG